MSANAGTSSVPNVPSSETEIKARLCHVAILQRRTQRELSELNQRWLGLVEERLALEAAIRQFEIYHTEHS